MSGIKVNYNSLQTLAIIIVLLGAAISFSFMFNAGKDQKSILIIALFTGWVLSPFAGLIGLNMITSRWKISFRFVHWFMILLSIASLIAYSGIFIPPDTKTAFIFLVAPFVSWIFIVIIYLLARAKLL